jgi:hypothetical protein
MPWVGFEPMIPVFKWAKTCHAVDHVATDWPSVALEITNKDSESLYKCNNLMMFGKCQSLS